MLVGAPAALLGALLQLLLVVAVAAVAIALERHLGLVRAQRHGQLLGVGDGAGHHGGERPVLAQGEPDRALQRVDVAHWLQPGDPDRAGPGAAVAAGFAAIPAATAGTHARTAATPTPTAASARRVRAD